jgi:hypothetical protein
VDGECLPPVDCQINGDCPEGHVCLDQRCTYVGGCTEDAHCYGEMECVDNECVGDPGPGGGDGPPIPCQINDDCPEHAICFNGFCEKGIECLEHAHCPPNHGCFRALCWPL